MAPVAVKRAQAAASSPLFRISSSAEPPVYRFNLSLPPRERHSEICRDFKHQIQDLRSLYDEVMAEMTFPWLNKFLARLCLTRVYSEEETEEIRGIAQETGTPKHMVIAFNTFLDLISSCLSGGTKVMDSGPFGKSNGIVHFRNLDWGMDVLRRVTICIEYVRDGTVIARYVGYLIPRVVFNLWSFRGVTYAGYVGVLTGVRYEVSHYSCVHQNLTILSDKAFLCPSTTDHTSIPLSPSYDTVSTRPCSSSALAHPCLVACATFSSLQLDNPGLQKPST